MTMPHERFRSIARLPEMLAIAAADDRIGVEMSGRAAELLARYPTDEMLRDLVASKHQGLPDDVAAALGDSIAWLGDLRGIETLSDDLVQWRRWVLRHYPQPWEVEDQRKAAGERTSVLWPSIDGWIRPEGPRP
jgi:hypothetical protein